jgi:hypothetical protein
MQLLEGDYAGASEDAGRRLSRSFDWRPILDREIGQGKLIIGFRPEAAEVTDVGTFKGTVFGSDLHGSYVMLHVRLSSNLPPADRPIVQVRAARDHAYGLDMPVSFNLNKELVRFFNPTTQDALSWSRAHDPGYQDLTKRFRAVTALAGLVRHP